MREKKSVLVILIIVLVCLPVLCLAQENYRSMGKRDPFEGPKEEAVVANTMYTPPPLDKRPPGLTGLLIAEVTVAGMAGSQQEKVVILKGVDNMSYLARKGSKLFDGYLASVSSEEVVFTREVAEAAGTKKTVKVVKRLYTEDK